MKKGCFVLSALCLALGLFVYFGMPGFSFTAYLLFALCALLLVVGLMLQLSRRFRKLMFVLGVLLSVCLVVGLVFACITGSQIYQSATAAWTPGLDYIIVLGAGLHGSTPSMTLSDRIRAATEYLKQNPDTICVVSGGRGPGEDMTEAQCMHDLLVASGISSHRIRMEDRSTSTYENLKFSMELIRKEQGHSPARVGIVSSEYHVYRACETAKRQNINPVGIPAKTSNWFLFLNYFLREIPANWYYLLIGD